MNDSRTQRFIRNLASGYLMMGINILYTMGTVPLALHYLSKEEFGLWALVVQVAGYFNMLDMGISSSTSRHLIEVKDNRASDAYGSMILTAWLVFAVQGVLIFAVSLTGCSFITSLVKVPSEFTDVFKILLLIQCVIVGMNFIVRIPTSLLMAHQRHDVCSIANIVSFIAAFGFLWIGFIAGMRLKSMLLSQAVGFLFATIIQFAACQRLGFFPCKSRWGNPRWYLFVDIFLYSKDIFLISLGSQLFAGTQIVIITRTMGLEAAAVWSVCTKLFMLAQMFALRIFDYGYATFSEMAVRQEWGRLRMRYRDIISLIAAIAVFMCVIAGVCNAPFLAIWTHGKISWHWSNSLLAALNMIVCLVFSRFISIASVIKQIGFAKYIDFIKGGLFVVISYFFAKQIGFAGIYITAIGLELFVSLPYALKRCQAALQCSVPEMLFGWLRNAGIFFALWMPVAAAVLVWILHTANPWVGLLGSGGVLGLTGSFLFWKVGLLPSVKANILEQFHKMRGNAARKELIVT